MSTKFGAAGIHGTGALREHDKKVMCNIWVHYKIQILEHFLKGWGWVVWEDKEFSENGPGLMLTKQTNVRKEVLFYVDF